nr:hypothetical protein [Tanacetum cinerariifolium]
IDFFNEPQVVDAFEKELERASTYFLSSSLPKLVEVVYVLTTPMPELVEDASVEAIRIRTKWENDDYICREHILNDSDATTHVCKDRCWFKTYEPGEDGSVLYMGDEHFAPVHGKGSVALEFSSGKTIILFNVLYVPKLRKNVLNKYRYKQVYEFDKYILSKSGVFIEFGYYNNGHVHYKRMLEMSKDDLIPAIDENLEKCTTYVILGIKIKHDNKGIVITQSRYIKKILKKFNRKDCSSVSTPMDPVEKLKPNTGKPVDQLEYSRAIGCLMYAMTSTRPDIAYAVGRLSRFTILKGYSDASWINHVEDSSSTSGWVFLLRGGAISWAFKKQTCITGSIIESELVALAAASKKA